MAPTIIHVHLRTRNQTGCARGEKATRNSRRRTTFRVLMQIPSLSAKPLADLIEEQLGVQRGNDKGDRPGENLQPGRIDELPHFLPIAGEYDEWDDGERELQAEHYLAEHQQVCRALLA